MATHPDRNYEYEEQRVRILRAIEEIEKIAAESRKLTSERLKLDAEQAKLMRDTQISPWLLAVQALIAGAALVGAGAGLAKLLMG